LTNHDSGRQQVIWTRIYKLQVSIQEDWYENTDLPTSNSKKVPASPSPLSLPYPTA
jgi:hypothetical protein